MDIEYKDFILDYPETAPVVIYKDQTIKQAMSRQQLHEALGHISDEALDNMIKRDLLPDGLSCNNHKRVVCISCREAKAKKKSFPNAIARSDELPGEHIYTDINFCSLPSLDEKTMSSVTVCAASRYSFLENHSSKGEAAAYLVGLTHYIERQTGNKLKRLTKDNGTEYEGLLRVFLEKNGVHVENTIPGTSQQNGIVERKHQTLWAKARAMILAANVPNEFWSWALTLACYMDNLTPQKSLNNVSSPYYRFFQRKHHGLYIAPFGALVYVTKDKVERENRVVAVGKPGMFIGYSDNISSGLKPTKKGYLVYYAESNTWKTEWHVTFEKGVYYTSRFPFQVRPKMTLNRDPLDQIWTNKEGESYLPPRPTPTQAQNQKALESVLRQLGGKDKGKERETCPLAPVEKTFMSIFRPWMPDPTCNQDQEDMDEEFFDASDKFELDPGEDPAMDEPMDPDDPTYLLHRLYMMAEETDGGQADDPKLGVPKRVVPKSTREAHSGPDRDFWLEAGKKEVDALISTGTFELCEDQDPTKYAILPTKTVRTIKTDLDGNEFGKERLVVGGHKQEMFKHYFETYSPTIGDPSMRLIFAFACIMSLKSYSFDFVTAFLNAELDIPVYIRGPQGFGKWTGKILKVIRALYGLKQSPRLWSLLLMQVLLGIFNLTQSATEPCFFYEFHADYTLLIFFWVDDLNVFCDSDDIVNQLVDYLESKFKIKKLGPIKTFLKLRFDYQPGKYVAIDQEHYIMEQIELLGLSNLIQEEEIPLDEKFYTNYLILGDPYPDLKRLQKLVGVLVYISMRTRPDIATAVSILASKISKPTTYLLSQCYQVFGYLLRTRGKKLVLGTSKSKDLVVLSDSDYAGDLSTCNSRACAVVYAMGSCILFQSKNLAKKTSSSTMAEFFGLHEALGCKQQVLNLMEELNFEGTVPLMLADNMAALGMAKSEGLTDTLKKIATKYRVIRQEFKEKMISLRHVGTLDNVADIGTKPLGPDLFNKFADQLLDPGKYLDLDKLPSGKDDLIYNVFGKPKP